MNDREGAARPAADGDEFAETNLIFKFDGDAAVFKYVFEFIFGSVLRAVAHDWQLASCGARFRHLSGEYDCEDFGREQIAHEGVAALPRLAHERKAHLLRHPLGQDLVARPHRPGSP